MRKIIEDLFQMRRELNYLYDPLHYINQIIPLKLHFWKAGEKAWTWVIPEGGIQIGEHTIKGKSKETILLPIHLDHPKQANDNLSGVAVAIVLSQLIKNPRYTFKFLFLPETIGTMAYLSKFGTKFKYGIVIDSVGGDGDLVTTVPLSPSLLHLYVEGKTNTFLSGDHLWSGNDERALESVGIPSIQISRSPFLEYHTEKDTPDRIIDKSLHNTVCYAFRLIKRIEADYIPKPKYKGVPCLSACGLWAKEYGSPHTFMKVERIWLLLGKNLHISEIAHLSGNSFDFVVDFINKLKSRGLV